MSENQLAGYLKRQKGRRRNVLIAPVICMAAWGKKGRNIDYTNYIKKPATIFVELYL